MTIGGFHVAPKHKACKMYLLLPCFWHNSFLYVDTLSALGCLTSRTPVNFVGYNFLKPCSLEYEA